MSGSLFFQALRDEIASGVWGGLQNGVGAYAKGILNCGSHMIDLLRFLIGDVTLKAVTKRRNDYLPMDPTLDLILLASDEVPLHLLGADHHHFFLFELTLTFERGQVCIEDLGRSLRLRRVIEDPEFPDRVTLPVGETASTQLGRALFGAVDNLYGHLVVGTPLVSDGQSALIAERLCHDMIAMSDI